MYWFKVLFIDFETPPFWTLNWNFASVLTLNPKLRAKIIEFYLEHYENNSSTWVLLNVKN